MCFILLSVTNASAKIMQVAHIYIYLSLSRKLSRVLLQL